MNDPSKLISNCASIDLEVGAKDHHIHSIGAVLGASPKSFLDHCPRGASPTVAALDRFVAKSALLVGHNIIAFDLPILRSVRPTLNLLRLPVIDTLRLNPLAFPRNPYHHLVKHYQDGKLFGGRLNDPINDARLTLQLLEDQLRSFEAIHSSSPALTRAFHWLTTRDRNHLGFDAVFTLVRRQQAPSDEDAITAIRSIIAARSCSTQGDEILGDTALLASQAWPLAYVLAWLTVAGGDSVMAPWVIHQFPQTGALLRSLRDQSCNKPTCKWCSEHYDAPRALKRWFGFDSFRPEPADSTGQPLQQTIVEAAMRGKHVLGILPTGTGKSVCYQIPALTRYERTGALTLVISPLVALMADQVASLEARGITSGATINGLLSMPERADVLDGVRLGRVGILLVSPEQLRSRSLRKALEQREIGGWVLDEAHCISKWGHDFRPDYRYIARFIKEKTAREQRDTVAPVMCLTATAKPDVITEIVSYFREKLEIDLDVSDGGAKRDNLTFLVIPTTASTKYAHIHQLLEEQFASDPSGGAIVYCATRRKTEEIAQFLSEREMSADYFHAGLKPDSRKEVQQRFINGELRVIVATNAFGMGIDKPDVRLVIHADVPGSLENYMQEAGRAGRDQHAARCVLVYTQEDIEQQFGLSARSRLTTREIQAILRSLRSLDRRKHRTGEVIATTGEILSDDEAAEDFKRDSATDDTRVRTAVSWLEEAELLQREENVVHVFPSSLRVPALDEAEKRLREANLASSYLEQLLSIVRRLFAANPDEGISTDELGVSHEKLPRAMSDLEHLGILSNDTAITAFVHAGTERSSRKRFEEANSLEIDLIELLREQDPDANGDHAANLNLRRVTQRLKDDGNASALPEKVTRILKSLRDDGRNEDGGKGSLRTRRVDPENIKVWVQREWQALAETARRRRSAANVLLDHFLESIPAGKRGSNLLAQSTLGKLQAALESSLEISSVAKDIPALLRRSLLWLHEQDVIQLSKGLAVFRSAMTIRLMQDKRGFVKADFEPLQLHYDQQTIQIHVMAEFVERGLRAMAEALTLAMDYFSVSSDEFINRWLSERKKQLSLQTTPASWNRIVSSLNNAVQERVVTDDRESSNVLVLAGPGSGKTRVLVHRIAYLIRVGREDPRGILALAYNRHAAVEIRKRLKELIGRHAIGVTVMTCHAFAMRLAGVSLNRRDVPLDTEFFRKVMQNATALLKGERVEGDEHEDDETDRRRDELLKGFRWILVDEYQDVGPEQYELIAAIAGRTLEEDRKLSLFAVGDDDQNIYSFAGASVEFIRRFEADYEAKPAFLVENYRSTANIIEAANLVIGKARTRMKAEHPIAINKSRRSDDAGGDWEALDPIGRGRVQILTIAGGPVDQAIGVMTELMRLAKLDAHWNWPTVAVIAREWKCLAPVRTFCELNGIPFQMADENSPNLWRLRETQQLIAWLNESSDAQMKINDLHSWVASQSENRWWSLLMEAIETYAVENEGRDFEAKDFIEWLVEWGRELRRRQTGLLLLSAHRAKGLEFDHVAVLDGGWERVSGGEDPDAQRRLFYVAMTRARKTLALTQFERSTEDSSPNPLLQGLENKSPFEMRKLEMGLTVPVEMRREYAQLGLGDVYIDFAGGYGEDSEVHRAIAKLTTGSELSVRRAGELHELCDADGVVVGRLAKGYQFPRGLEVLTARVNAIVMRRREDSQAEFQDRLRCERWEVVVPELVFLPPA